MRVAKVFPLLCMVSVLATASPWEDFLARRRSGPQAVWSVCVPAGTLADGAALLDATYQQLVTGGDVSLVHLGQAEARDLGQQRGWGNEPHWVLLSPSGKVAATHPGAPTGAAILDALHAAGGRPRFAAREAFLKEHPEQGEARLEALSQAFRLARARLQGLDRAGKVRVPAWHADPGRPMAPLAKITLPPGPEGDALAEDLFDGVAAILEQLVEVPGWLQEARAITPQLMYWDASRCVRMRKVLARVAQAAEQALAEDPYAFDAANLWIEAADCAGLPPGNPAGLCLPVPGRPWPPPAMLSRLLEPQRRRGDWGGMLKTLADLSPQGPPQPQYPGTWEDYLKLRGALAANLAVAYGGQGAWDLAASALDESRHWGGSANARGSVHLLRLGLGGTPAGDLAQWRTLLDRLTGKDAPAPEAPALPAPLRLVLLGAPKWLVPWAALAQAPELAPWAPWELRWEIASREAEAPLLARHGWAPGPRWALLRGEEVLATGATCPAPGALAAALAAGGPTQLQLLQQVLDGQREHRAARRERFSLLLRRMPDPRLEATLAEDAAQAGLTLDFGRGAPWGPDPEIWGAAAHRVLPRLERELRSWPGKASLWAAWVSWARFHPAAPSILTLAQSLPYWEPRRDWRGELPFDAQRAVAAELRRQGNFNAMRDWFRAAWEALDHRPLGALKVWEKDWVLERRQEEETAVFAPLRDALQALRCTEEQAQLERVFGEMMGRDPARRR